ncbi:MAG: hypothetical protein HKN08_12745 [Gammaproteobacteria bacterium]|nr:hypothetical protein [Gammaproteobacteria bacterium]
MTTVTVIGESLPFTSDSIKEIEEKYTGQHFLLVLWEISCLPCHEEMALLGNMIELYPELNVVMVGTDHIDKDEELSKLLAKHKLANIDSWLFAEKNIEKLRYSIDPEWYGELPRNYFYDIDSGRVGHSGKLTEEILLEWLSLHNIL